MCCNRVILRHEIEHHCLSRNEAATNVEEELRHVVTDEHGAETCYLDLILKVGVNDEQLEDEREHHKDRVEDGVLIFQD